MQLINLTVFKENNILTTQAIAIDINDIVGPIRFNSASKSYFAIYAKYPPAASKSYLHASYQVNESLSTIKAMSQNLLNLAVLRRDSTLFPSEQMIFNASRVVSFFVTTGIGTEFLYAEMGAHNPVKYIVSDSIASIISQQQVGGSGGTNTVETQTVTGTSMTLSNVPVFVYGIFLNGQRLTLAVDYTISGGVITFASALSADSITVVYTF